MFATERHNEILGLLKDAGKVHVEELVAHFNVTPQTIRTDLKILHKANKLVRFHGGAQAIDGRVNVEYEARRDIAALQKRAIGEAAAQLIPNNASLFVNIGTTTEAVSDALLNHKGLMVITNNINVASHLRLGIDNDIIIAGGNVRASDGGIIGEAAVDFIKNFKVDFAIIGSSAIDGDGALLDFDFREVKVTQAIMENSRTVILVADSSKWQRKAPVRIGHISQVDILVTDRIPIKKYRKVCTDADTKVIETYTL